MQPILEELDPELDEAAASLGASRWQTFRRVLLPQMLPSAITGFSLAFARAVGEYGLVVFINEYQFAAAFAVASPLAGMALVTLAVKSLIEWQARRVARQLSLENTAQ